MISIIDYEAGNLHSVSKALSKLGYSVEITTDPQMVIAADIVILPGVGAAGDAMENLKRYNLIDALQGVVKDNKPFLGICLGIQIMLSSTEESGGCECLGLIPGTSRRLPPSLKVPHIGWNQVEFKMDHPIFRGIPDCSAFYFVHSYYADPDDKSVIAGVTDYGVDFCSLLLSGNLLATQFHPEKSGDVGLKFLDNFLTYHRAKR